jgi:hypothetical protein
MTYEDDEEVRRAFNEGLHREQPPPGANGHGASQERAKAQNSPLLLLPHQFPTPSRPTLVAGIIGHGMEVLVYGSYEAGKTFFMVDLFGHVSAGQPYRGRAVDKGLTVYLAGERQWSVQGRVLAWMKRHAVPLSEAEPFPFAVLSCPLDLHQPGSDAFQRLVDDIDRLRQQLGLSVAAIVADTVHSLTPGGDESNRDFGLLMGRMRDLRQSATGDQPKPPVLAYTHHSGKDEERGPRGGTGLPAAMDLMIRVKAEAKCRMLVFEKASDTDKTKLELEPFVIDSVTLRHDEAGEPVQYGVAVAVAPHDAEAEEDCIRREIDRLHSQGLSQTRIAQQLKIHQSTVSRHLKSKPQGGKA